jgi:hypothetical protein
MHRCNASSPAVHSVQHVPRPDLHRSSPGPHSVLPCHACPQVLRLAVYEMTQLDMQAHALNDHVEVARALAQYTNEAAVGFVNGVLRSAARAQQAGELPLPEVRALA